MQLYFEANTVENDRKVAVLLTVVGARTYETLRSLLAPARPRDKSFDELLGVLKKHFDPKPLVIAECFRFYQRSQKSDESVADFVADLRRLCIKCEFGDFLNQALRDRFVCGLKTNAIQKKLLTEADLTMQKAQEIAQSMESADKSSNDLRGDATSRPTVSDTVDIATLVKEKEKAKTCYRCGRRHDAKVFKFKEANCHRCGKRGHIAPVCRSTTSPPSVDKGKKCGFRPKKAGSTKWLEADEDDSVALPLFTLQGELPQPPIVVNMIVKGSPVQFDLDTGAVVTVMPERKFRQLFPEQFLRRSSVKLKTFTGQKPKVVGETDVDVCYQDQEPKTLPIVVVRGEGPPLLGRNWLQHFILDWSNIKAVLHERDTLNKLLAEYADVFSNELGKITPVKARIVVSPSAAPKFHHPRPVPYALKPLVEQKLDRLQRAGVLEPVTHSDWATPIVTVPKRDGEVRICGDYKVTVNPFLEIDQYPLPRHG